MHRIASVLVAVLASVACFGSSATRADDAALLLSCGRLALRANDLSKARTYLEKSANLGGPIDAFAELGALLERSGEKDRALSFYRRGLEQSASDRSPARRGSGMGARYRLVGKS